MLGGPLELRHHPRMFSESPIEHAPIARMAVGAMFRPAVSWGLSFVIVTQLAACSPVGMAVGAGATAVNMAMEERGFGNAVRDNVIWTDINGRLLNKDPKLFQNVNLQVQEGRVLLTGFVQQPEDRV